MYCLYTYNAMQIAFFSGIYRTIDFEQHCMTTAHMNYITAVATVMAMYLLLQTNVLLFVQATFKGIFADP